MLVILISSPTIATPLTTEYVVGISTMLSFPLYPNIVPLEITNGNASSIRAHVLLEYSDVR